MKFKLTLYLLIFLSPVIFSQSIKITNPKGGESYLPGKGFSIKWQVAGKMNNNVKIRLFTPDKSTKIMDIVNKTPNDGEFYWKIPANMSVKCIVMVKTIDNAVFGDSSPFSIETPEIKKLNVWEPVSGVSYNHGDQIKIVWMGTGFTGNLNVYLEKSDGTSKTPIKTNHPANKSTIYYKVPAGVTTGTYKIKIVWGAITDVSGVFTIKSQAQKKVMDIMEPKSGEVFNTGSNIKIQWISSGITGNILRVFICKGGPGINYVATISNNWPNSPHLQSGWQIPANFTEGNYKIVVQEGVSTYYHGNVFKINKMYQLKNPGRSKNSVPQIRTNQNLRFSSGKKPVVFSFMPNEFAKKKASGIPGTKTLYLAKLRFLWKDPDGDLKNGKWHFLFKGTKSGQSGNKSGNLNSAMYGGSFNGTSGSISDFVIMNVSGIDKEVVNITFVLEDEHGNFSDKVTGQIILSPF